MNYRTMLLTGLRNLADGTASYWPVRTVWRVRMMFARLRIDADDPDDFDLAEQRMRLLSGIRVLTVREQACLRELVDLALALPHRTPSKYVANWMREHREALFGSFTFTVDLVATPAEPELPSSPQALCDAARRLVSEAGLHELWGAAALLDGYDKAWWQARQHELIASAGKGPPISRV
jgi:hypothetical protein